MIDQTPRTHPRPDLDGLLGTQLVRLQLLPGDGATASRPAAAHDPATAGEGASVVARRRDLARLQPTE